MARKGYAPSHPFKVALFDLEYEGNLQNNIDFNIYYFGAFEKPLLFFLRDCILNTAEDNRVFYDIGANIGQHSLFMSNYAAQVHAFEPYMTVRERIAHQINLNNINNICVHEVGLSNEETKLPFFAPTGRNQGIGSFDASTVNKGNKNIGELQLVRGDDYIAQHKLEPATLVKIDVEGFEKPVLAGLQETLTKYRPVVVCEITYGGDISFRSKTEILDQFPANYELLTFNTRKADGSKSRRKQGKARSSGHYQLIPYNFEFPWGQDDIVACPKEKLQALPRSNQ